MDMQDFIDSLILFKEENLPTQQFPLGNIQYQSICKRTEINEQIDCHNNSQFFLKYIDKSDNNKIKYKCIDEHLHYIKQLDSFNIDLRGTKLSELDVALSEAIVHFDRFAHMDNNPYFECELYDGVSTALSLYDSPKNAPLFDNNPILKDMFFSQLQYFIKKYLCIRLDKNISDIQRGTKLSLKIKNALTAYYRQDNLYDIYNKQVVHKFNKFIKQENH